MLFSYYAELSELDKEYPFIAFFAYSYAMLLGAATFIYVQVLTSQKQLFRWHYFLHSLPYLFFTIILYFKLQGHANPVITEAILEIENTETPLMWGQTLVNIFLGPIYLIISLFRLRNHRRKIQNDFSFSENIDLQWLKHVVLSTTGVWIVAIIMTLISNYNDLIPSRIGDNIIFAFLVILVFFIGYHGMKQQVIFSPVPSTKNSKPKSTKVKAQYVKSSLKDKESKEYLDILLNYMKDQQPYLDGKLSLAQVAESLDISTNHLSQVINSELNKNFFDFINGYRVELIKEKMLNKSNSHLTLLGMAYESGFNSKSTFNIIFKKFTETTPSQFMRSQRS